jgi:pimeloyl-ACP methyl ester carboxylesterase
MVPLPIVLLPGLHGTGDLFEPFLACAPPHLRPIVVPLPEKSSYAELLEEVRRQLPAGRFAIVAESFSGPLAVALARGASERVVGVILCNSFHLSTTQCTVAIPSLVASLPDPAAALGHPDPPRRP